MKNKYRIVKENGYYWIYVKYWFFPFKWNLYSCLCYSDLEDAEHKMKTIINGPNVIKTYK